MTMKLVIKNEDAGRTATVNIEDGHAPGVSGGIKHVESFRLGPGEQRDIYIHAARMVHITEDALASVPKPLDKEPPDAA